MEIQQNLQKYQNINTLRDAAKEKYIFNADFCGQYGFPKLKPIHADLQNLKPVDFGHAKTEKNPRQSVCHFFTDDYMFERLWNDADKHISYLQYFQYVRSPDFSFYSDMPLVLQLFSLYKSRALSHYLTLFGIKIIPVVSWSDEKSFEWCFDGLPQNSTLAISTNGCFSKEGKECYVMGFKEMCKRLNPHNVLVVGREIPVNEDVEIVYMKSCGQVLEERSKAKNGKSDGSKEDTEQNVSDGNRNLHQD